MTRTRTSVLLTVLLVVGALTTGLSVGVTTHRAQDGGEADATVDSGDVFWQGQFVGIDAGDGNASEVWSIREVQDGTVGSLATEVLLDGNGSAVLSTSNLEGQYVVVNENDEPVVFENGTAQRTGEVNDASFQISAQSLNATFADSTVLNDDSDDARTDFRVQSNRADYRFYLFSEDLSTQELADLFPDVEVQDDRAVVTRNVGSDAVLDANFTGVEAGTYNVTVFTTDGTAQDSAAITVAEPTEGSAGLANATVVEHRGDVARFNVTLDDTDRATVALGSEQVNYRSQFTVVDEDGDGVVTVEVNTYREGLSANASGVSAAGEDRVIQESYELDPGPVSERLDTATYPIEVSVGVTTTAVGSLTLEEPSIGSAQVWTAPESASVDSASQLLEAVSQDDEIAYQDWAIVQIQASGLYGYVGENDTEVVDASELNDSENGLSMTLTSGAEINVPEEAVSLERARLLVDDENDQMFLVLDSSTLEENVTYRANFTVSEANPYVDAEEATSLVTNFTVVPRDVSFEEPVEMPASSEATVSGNSTLAAGTELTVVAQNTQGEPFLKRQSATVSEDGSWEATFDFSDVSEGTEFNVSLDDHPASATGSVVSADGAEAEQNETTPEEAETTPAQEETTPEEGEEETTPEDEDEDEGDAVGADEEETTPEEEEEETTPEEEEEEEEEAADTTTTTTTTTTEEEEEDTTTTTEEQQENGGGIPGFGPVAVLVALAILLAVGALAARRR